MTAPLEQMARALVARDALVLRELVLAWQHLDASARSWAEPESEDLRVRVAAAALAELLAEREGVEAPAWARNTGAFDEPFFALAAASRMRSVRELCERESPEALRRHGVLAPANFLELV